MVHADAARTADETLEPFDYDPGVLKDEEVEIKIEYCGVCYSDLSMLKNDWGMSQHSLVPGHEVVGTIAAVGGRVTTVAIGQHVGLGWFSHSCLHCEWCMSDNQNLCLIAEQTIVGRYGGFADKVRAHQEWVTPLPKGIDPAKVDPLLCGGLTVFNPLVQFDVKPTDRVAVIGIGGLGHLALHFCELGDVMSLLFQRIPIKKLKPVNWEPLTLFTLVMLKRSKQLPTRLISFSRS